MNKVYKIIWSNVRKCYVVVSEIARNRGKNSTKSIVEQLGFGALSAGRCALPLLLTGFLLQSVPGFASVITDKNGASVINAGDKVHNIYAQRQVTSDKVSLSVNQFQQYNVTAGDVANMHFRMTKDGKDTNVLLNLVKERINIGGTVNAIKGNRIDGDLYFISSNGMAVGKTGVINAGRMVGLAPDSTYFNRILWNGDSDLASYYLSDLSKFGQRDEKGNFIKMSDRWSVNNNNNASIDVAGQINVRSGIVLGASNIVIQNGSLLQSRKDLDFTNLVNAKKEDGSVITSAGLNKTNTGMTMVPATDKSGDIILRAEAVQEYTNNLVLPLQSYDAIFNTSNTANVEVKGAIKGDAGVDVSANAKTTFDNTTWMGIKPTDMAKELFNDLGINMDADWAVKKNTASVALKQGGSIEAGGRAALQSDAGLSVKLKTATLGKKTYDSSAAIPVAAIDVAKIKNKALVDVQGTLKSGSDMSLAATAVTSATLTSVASVPNIAPKPDPNDSEDKGNAIYVGVAWITGDSVADVILGAGEAVTAGGAFSANAKATSTMGASTSVEGRDKTFASTSIGVIDYDSAANVTLKRSVTANSVKVNAENNVAGLDLSVNDGTGWGENVYVQYQVAGDTIANVLAKKVIDKFGWTAFSNGGSLKGLENLFTKTQEYVSAGASVGVLDSRNTANITVAPGVVLKATGENVKKDKNGNVVKDEKGNAVADGFVSLTANTYVGSLHHSVAGEANKQDTDTASKVTVASAVLYSRLDNDAAIDLQSDATTHKGVTLISDKGDVTLNAGAKQVYDPLEPMKNIVDRLGKLVNTLKAAYKEFPELTNLHTEAVKLYEKRKDGSISESTAGASLADLGYSLGTFLTREAKNLIAVDQGVQGLIQDVSNAISPASYTNYYVRSYTVDSQDSGSNLDLAASVNVARLHNKGIVSLGENASVTAGKNINMDASTDTNVVSFTGNGGEYLALSESNGNGVGASVAVQDFAGDSMILSGKGVSLKAEKGAAGKDSGKVTLHTNNSMIQTGVILSAGKADSHTGVSGSLNILAGGSNSLVLVDDESVVKAANAVTLAADNSTTVSNIVGGLALGSSKTNLALGAGVAWNALDINSMAAIADSGTDAAVTTTDTDTDDFKKKTADEQNAIKAANTLARARKLAKERASVQAMDTAFALSEKKMTASLGTKTAKGAAKGSVTARDITVTANSGGTVNSVALEGASNSENHSGFDTFDKWSSVGASVKNQTTKAAKAYIASPLTKLQKWYGNPEVKSKWDFSGYNPITASNELSTAAFNAAAAGSVAINQNAGETAAVMERMQLNLRKQANSEAAGTLNNTASDDLFTGAWSGAAALNWFTGGEGSPSNNGALKGALGTAVSLNLLNRNVNALILSSDISQAGAVKDMAVKNGAEAAASLGLAVTNDREGTAADGAVAFGLALNKDSSDVHALLRDSSSSYEKSKDGVAYSDGTDISVSAYDGDVQVAGGVDLSWVKNDGLGVSVGATAALSVIRNDMQSGIKGGSYNGLTSLKVAGEDALVQTNAAVGLGLSRSAKGFTSAGSVAYAALTNTNLGFISDTTAVNASGEVSVTNQDISTKTADGKDKNKYLAYLKERKIDATGLGYLGKKAKDTMNKASGNDIVNVAVDIAESKSLTGSIALAVGDVTNTFNSDITGNKKIVADAVKGAANVHSNVVSVAVGASVSEEAFGGVGSVAVNDLKQDNIVSVTGNRDGSSEKSGILANTVSGTARNTSRIIGFTGDFAGGTNVAGLAVAYNMMNDTTGVYFSKNRIGAKDAAKGTSVSLDAQNDAYALAFSLGAAASYKDTGTVAAHGNFGVNRGVNNTVAVIGEDKDGKKAGTASERDVILDVASLQVNAADKTTKTSIAGDVNLALNEASLALGVGVALTDIGVKADNNTKSEKARAEINNADITTVKNGSKAPVISAKTTNTSSATTTAVGVGITKKSLVGGQIILADTETNKLTTAGLHDTVIDKGNDTGSKAAGVTVHADSKSEVGAGAAAVQISGSDTFLTGIVAVGRNRVRDTTKADVSYAKKPDAVSLNAGNLSIGASSSSSIMSVAAGASVTAKGIAAIGGSGSYNAVENNVSALLHNANVKSKGNVGVVALSDDAITNYAGIANVAVGGTGASAAIGVTVSNNTVSGKTEALISNSTVVAEGSNDDDKVIRTKSKLKQNTKNDAYLIDGAVTTNTWKSSKLQTGRMEEKKTGVVVDSSATHSIASVMANGGVAVATAGSVMAGALAGIVNLNYISGATTAKVLDSRINTESVRSDVHVHAADYSNVAELSGTAAFGFSEKATGTAGFTGTTNSVDRVTAAGISTSSTKWNEESKQYEIRDTDKTKNLVYANNFSVTADAKQAMSGLNVTGALALSSTGSFETGDNWNTNSMESSTVATVTNTTVRFRDTARVEAVHEDRTYNTNVAAGLAIAADVKDGVTVSLNVGVGKVNEKSVVTANVENSKLEGTDPDKSSLSVKADNASSLDTTLVSVGVAVSLLGFGVASSVSLNDLNSNVTSRIAGSELTAGTMALDTKNTIFIMDKVGTGGGGGSLGVGVGVDTITINDTVSTVINNSTLTAKKKMTVGTGAERMVDGNVTGAGLGIGEVAVNVLSVTVNGGLQDTENVQDEQGGTYNRSQAVQTVLDKVNTNVNRDLSQSFHGMSASEKKEMQKKIKAEAKLKGADQSTGVHAYVLDNSKLEVSDGDLSILNQEFNDGDLVGGSYGLGGLSVNVPDATFRLNLQNDILVKESELTANSVNLSARHGNLKDTTDGIKAYTYQANLSVAGIGTGNSSIITKGTTGVQTQSANLTARNGNLILESLDTLKGRSKMIGVTAGLGIGVGVSVARFENLSANNITVTGESELTAKKEDKNSKDTEREAGTILLKASRTGTVAAKSLGVGVGVGEVIVNKGQAIDKSSASVSIHKNNTFAADSLRFEAVNAPVLKAESGGTEVGGIGVSVMKSEARAESKATVWAAESNRLLGDEVLARAVIGKEGQLMTHAETHGTNGTVIGVNPNTADAITKTTASVEIDSAIYKTAKTGSSGQEAAVTNLSLVSQNYASRKTIVGNTTIGLVLAIGIGNAEATAEDNSKAGAYGGDVKNLTIRAEGKGRTDGHADGDSGGIFSFADPSMVTLNTINHNEAKLGGVWNVTESASVESVQDTTSKGSSRTGAGGVIGVNWAKSDNNVTADSKIKVEEAAILNAGQSSMRASNSITTGAWENDKYNNHVNIGGLINGVPDTKSTSVVKAEAEIAVEERSRVTTSLGQEYNAHNTMALSNQVEGKGGGALEFFGVHSINKTTDSSKITVGKGSVLEQKGVPGESGDLTLITIDSLDLNSLAECWIGGLAGVTNTNVKNDVERKNEIEVNGALSSTGDVNLFSGNGTLRMTTQAESHNNTVIPFYTGPDLNCNLKNVNDVHVGESGSVTSFGDINISAETGWETLKKRTVRVAWLAWGDPDVKEILTNSPGKTDIVENNINYVKVDGSLTAGNARKLDITVTGSAVPDTGGAYTPVTTQTPLAIKVDSTGVALTEKDIKTGNMDYATQLGAQLAAVNKLIEQYSAESKEEREKHLASYLGYVQQRQRIFEEMDKRGLYDWQTVNGQLVKIYRTEGYTVRYVEIPEITASGGNISVQTNTLYGKGKLEANGAPQITVTNNSNAYLKLDGIQIGKSGGAIRFRGTDITSNAKINEMNTGKGSEAAFSTLRNDSASTRASAITVTNDNKAGTSVQMKDSAGKTVSYIPITDVAVAGILSNSTGDVRISNTSGSIIIDSGTEDNVANVMGRTVQLIARDSISQEFINGIVNIGGDPRVLNATEVEKAKTSAKNEVSANSNNHKSNYTKLQTNLKETLTDITQAGLGRIAGDNIYISAADINVNGLIQSGYNKYEADIGEINLSSVTVKKNEVTVQGRTMYKVNDGGKVKYDENIGAFKYVVQVYYDPAGKKLVVEDIDTKGGRIYLTGRISSTGNGRILAASGGADISVTNRTGLDMQVGKVLNNNIEGKITITDLANDTWTEYTTSSTKTINHYGQFANDSVAAEKNTEIVNGIGFNNGATPGGAYKLKEGLRYNWSYGQTNGNTIEYHAVSKNPFWQNQHTSVSEMSKLEASAGVMALGGDGEKELDQGAFIGELANDRDGKIAGTKFGGLYENKVSKDNRYDFYQWKENDEAWRFWAKTDYHMTWKRDTDATQSYTFSLKADRDIGIGFLGKENGSIALVNTDTNRGSINLAGDVKNNAAGAALLVKTGDSINQSSGTSLTTGKAQLKARRNIENIQITSLGSRTLNTDGRTYTASDNVVLYAESEQGGNVDVTAVGGTVEGQALPGNVSVQLLSSGKNAEGKLGNVSLKADGNIVWDSAGKMVSGQKITLESVKGSIGDKKHPILIAGPVTDSLTDLASAGIYASAQKDIYLQQDKNDMLIGSIISREGDVGLTAKYGRLLDALPQTEGTDNMTENELVRSWIDAGLIKNTDDYEGAYITRLKKDAAEYEARVKEQFALFTSGERVTDAIKEMFTKKDGSKYASVNEFLKADTQYQAIVEKYTHPTYTWTKEQLLYAIRNAIVNKESGETAVTESKQANIQGKNVNLYAASIGKTSEGNTTILAKDLVGSSETAVSNLKKLASADAADVIMKDAAGNILSFAIDDQGKQVVTARDARGNTVNTDGRIYSFTIGHLNPIGVKATGRMDAKAYNGEIFIAGRSDEKGQFSPVNVGTVESDKEVRLYGRQGIYNAFIATISPNILAKDLIVYGGIKDIGAQDKYLGVKLSGDLLTAAADGNVFIKNLNDHSRLWVGSLYAGNTLGLDSYYGFLASNNPDYATAYLNAGKQIILSADPFIGTVGSTLFDSPLRILNSGTPVSVTAESANILGVNGLRGEDAVLVLGENRVVGEFKAVSNGNIKVTGDIVAGRKTGGKLSLQTGNGHIEVSGNLTSRNGDIELTTKAGDIEVTGDIDAGRDITLKTGVHGLLLLHDNDNEGNRVNIHAKRNISMQSEHTGIAVWGKVTADTGDVSVSTKYSFINYRGDVKAGGNVTAEMKESGNITYTGNIQAGKSITATILGGGDVSYTGNVTTDAKTGGDITAKIDGYGDISYVGTTSAGGNIAAEVGGCGSITYTGDTQSGKNISAYITEDGKISYKGATKADGSITGTVSGNGSVEYLGNVQAGLDVTVKTNNGDVLYAGDVRAQGNITGTVNRNGDVTYAGAVSAGGEVNAATRDGWIEYGGSVEAGGRQIIAEVGNGWIWYKGDVNTNGNVTAYMRNGNIVYANSVEAGGNVEALVERGDIIYLGKVKAGNNVIANTSIGDILYGSDVTAGRSVITRTGSGSITYMGRVTAGKDLPEQLRNGYGKVAYYDRYGLIGYEKADGTTVTVRNAKPDEIKFAGVRQ